MEQWLGPDGGLYPAGQEGELAVGCYQGEEDHLYLSPAATRKEAETMFDALLKHETPKRVLLESGPHQGRKSAVAFIVQCSGGTNWHIVKETEGAQQEIPSGRLDLPDVKFDVSLNSLLK